jgi:Fe-S-cluster containining protein
MNKKNLEKLVEEYESTKKGKCCGKCCEDFYLPFDEKGLEELYENHVHNKEIEQHNKDIQNKKKDGEYRHDWKPVKSEIWLVYVMAIYLGSDHISGETGEKLQKTVHHWSCRFHDKETKKCTIYEVRPHFCRTFPNYHDTPDGLQRCLYKGCTFEHSEDLMNEILSITRTNRNKKLREKSQCTE